MINSGILFDDSSQNRINFFDSQTAEFYFWRKKLRYQLKKAFEKVSSPTAASTELFSYPVGVAMGTPTNLAAALPSLQSISLPPDVNVGVAIGWNMVFDATAAIINGVNLLLDEDDYRHTQNKVKGVVSILSGVVGLAFSYNPRLEVALLLGSAGFAAPAFAFMALCDLVNASIDFIQASKEVDRETWFEERVQEINFLNNRIDELEKFTDTENVDRSIKLIADRNRLKELFEARAKVFCSKEFIAKELGLIKDLNTKFTNEQENQIENERKKRMEILENKIEKLEENKYKKELKIKNINWLEPNDHEKNIDYVEHSTKVADYEKKKITLIMKSISFVSMTLFAIAPFVGPVAPALIIPAMVMSTFVTCYYLYEHRGKFQEALNAISNLFPPSSYSAKMMI